MATADQQKQRVNAILESTLTKAGFTGSQHLASTLQGSVWRSIESSSKREVVIKVTNRQLHDRHVIIVQDQTVPVHEDVLKERKLLHHLTKKSRKPPNSIVKYITFFKTNVNFYLVMEHGGVPLFDFVVKVHTYLEAGKLDVAEWHKLAKIIFTQMIESVDFIHSHNVCHFDVSIENYVISDVNVIVGKDDKIQFDPQKLHNVQVKLCDFGLAELFDPESGFDCTKFCGKETYKSPEVMNKKRFNAKSNDVWCLGVCLFMLLIGAHPWQSAAESDLMYARMMKANGFEETLKQWKLSHYVDDDSMELLKSILQSQQSRATLNDIKKCAFLH